MVLAWYFIHMLNYLSSLMDLFFSSHEVKFSKLTLLYPFSQCSIVPAHKFTAMERLQRSAKNAKRKVSGTEVSDPSFFLTHQ